MGSLPRDRLIRGGLGQLSRMVQTEGSGAGPTGLISGTCSDLNDKPSFSVSVAQSKPLKMSCKHIHSTNSGFAKGHLSRRKICCKRERERERERERAACALPFLPHVESHQRRGLIALFFRISFGALFRFDVLRVLLRAVVYVVSRGGLNLIRSPQYLVAHSCQELVDRKAFEAQVKKPLAGKEKVDRAV